jgi:lycopene cyclase CruA
MVDTLRTPHSQLRNLEDRYPSTVAAFSTMPDGERALRAVIELERKWVALYSGQERPDPFSDVPSATDLPPMADRNNPQSAGSRASPNSGNPQYDVVIAGGGLGLVVGVALARRGLRVMIFDRDRVGAAHREWNISERELSALAHGGIFSREEIASTVAAHYTNGRISFDSRDTGVQSCPLTTRGVLDVAVDAQALLDLARKRFIQAGGVILENRSFRRLHMAKRGPVASVFELEGLDGTEFYRTRLAIDTMGSVSPIAMGLNNGLPFDGVCPTVGTVMRGINLDRDTGDVLVSVSPARGERQYIWEGFPGRGDETTVYLFYYDRTGKQQAPGQSLLDLFEQYFTFLPTYNPLREGAQHLKPVFGYIPARHGRTGRTAARGLICLGDSAAGQSPLTFCGFGSFVRHIGRTSALLHYALEHDLLEGKHLRLVSPHQANLRVAWVFSRFMRPWPGSDPADVNGIMNHFTRALADLGPATTVRFLQDRYSFPEYLRIMLTTARYFPGVVPLTMKVLGSSGILAWLCDIAYFAASDGRRAVHHLLSPRAWKRLERMAPPSLTLRLKAFRTAQQAES